MATAVEHRYWDRAAECMPRPELARLQAELLRKAVAYAYDRVPYYRQLLQEAKVSPEQVRSPDDLRRLPFTTKETLAEHYPFGMLAVPLDEVVRIHASSGTTGNPKIVPYTKGDLERWSDLVARIAVAAGVRRNDIAQIAFGYGLFTGGFGLHYGLEKVGAMVIPSSSGNTRRQIKLMRELGTTVLVSTPSYAIYIGETLAELGIAPEELQLRLGMFGGERTTEQMRAAIEELLGITATDNYGLSELSGPGVSGECLERNGLHIWEDHFIVEVIDPETGETMPPGAEGELTFTTLQREAMPMLRYRTGDLARLIPEPCACGRTHIRMTPVHARTDDMLIIRGVNVYPSQIEAVLREIEGTSPHYQIVVDRRRTLEQVELLVEVDERIFHDRMRELHRLEEQIKHGLYTALGINIKVSLVEPRTLARSEGGKSIRIIER